jgi:myosin VIIa
VSHTGIGILPLLDEELVMPKGSDDTFLNKMHLQHSKSKYYQKVLKNPKQFVIQHYAGQVCYDVSPLVAVHQLIPGFLWDRRSVSWRRTGTR